MSQFTSSEKLCAALLFMFQAGRDAQAAYAEGAKNVDVHFPSDEELAAVLQSAPAGFFRALLPGCEELVQQIAEAEPGDVKTLWEKNKAAAAKAVDILGKVLPQTAPLGSSFRKPR